MEHRQVGRTREEEARLVDSKDSSEAKCDDVRGTNKTRSNFETWPWLSSKKRSFDKYFEKIYGFRLHELTSFDKFVDILYRPTDSASLGVVRALFGFCMVLDVVEERGLADIDIKWGDPWDCHFPLIHGMIPPTLPWMIVIYAMMWAGAFGIMLGYRFKLTCGCFVLSYWYVFFLDKSYWNNHTYLYGIVATLFWLSDANRYFALDSDQDDKATDTDVPFWNYLVLKFQFFVLYFLAGLKKSNREWLEGYAMTKLSRHWVFNPFKIFLTVEQTDFLVVHWFAFVFDLTVGFWMLFDKTRIPAMIFCVAFHLMNSRLFSIGMFPYVCLATLPLFWRVDWPRKFRSWLRPRFNLSLLKNPIDNRHVTASCDPSKVENRENLALNFEKKMNISKEIEVTNEDEETENSEKATGSSFKIDEKVVNLIRANDKKEINRKGKTVTRKQRLVVSLLLCHFVMQLFLPYSHFITKGYNNWVPGLYGYSWDMMVHSWDILLVVVRVHDNVNDKDHYLDPEAWLQNDRWMKHGDMARQYAFCLKDNLMRQKEEFLSIENSPSDVKRKWDKLSSNLSIYIDVWCSLNGRFQQRVFNPNVDMLTVDWHPFKPVSYLMPLLTQYNSYREKIDSIQRSVYSWSNYTDVLFVADFPEMHLENYIRKDFDNVSLTILEGEVVYNEEGQKKPILLQKGNSFPVRSGRFHKITTISPYPACYMYTYANQTKQGYAFDGKIEAADRMNSLTIAKELDYKIDAWTRALSHIANAFFHLAYDVPMVRRIRIEK